MIIGGQYQNDVRVVGHTPIQAHTHGTATATSYGNYAIASGNSTTTYSGGHPIVGGSHNQGLMVKMFKEGDPVGANALSARDVLGPKWQEAVASNNFTCFGG
jgi:hypothetical protein